MKRRGTSDWWPQATKGPDTAKVPLPPPAPKCILGKHFPNKFLKLVPDTTTTLIAVPPLVPYQMEHDKRLLNRWVMGVFDGEDVYTLSVGQLLIEEINRVDPRASWIIIKRKGELEKTRYDVLRGSAVTGIDLLELARVCENFEGGWTAIDEWPKIVNTSSPKLPSPRPAGTFG